MNLTLILKITDEIYASRTKWLFINCKQVCGRRVRVVGIRASGQEEREKLEILQPVNSSFTFSNVTDASFVPLERQTEFSSPLSNL